MSNAADVVTRYYAAINARDWGAYPSLLAADVVTHGFGGAEFHGIEGTLAFDRTWTDAMPDLEIVQRHQVASDGRVASENAISGTFTQPLRTSDGEIPPTGRVGTQHYVGTFRVVDGKIAEQTIYGDRLEIFEKLGLMPSGNA